MDYIDDDYDSNHTIESLAQGVCEHLSLQESPRPKKDVNVSIALGFTILLTSLVPLTISLELFGQGRLAIACIGIYGYCCLAMTMAVIFSELFSGDDSELPDKAAVGSEGWSMPTLISAPRMMNMPPRSARLLPATIYQPCTDYRRKTISTWTVQSVPQIWNSSWNSWRIFQSRYTESPSTPPRRKPNQTACAGEILRRQLAQTSIDELQSLRWLGRLPHGGRGDGASAQ
ncbi:hypothetical protein GGR53DRAFT_464508 [Hypoxylon sp. FL1150]|nr:hypothetical protein GGR53DRAFT_464508 [Hypoxylon sp. FL1150]